jgi:hypothetical protein
MKETILGLRWFWLNLRLILVCTALAFWNKVASHAVRLQVRLVRWSGLFVFAFSFSLLAFLPGCASQKPLPSTYAPSSAPVLRAVTAAKESAAALKGHVTTPEGLRKLASLDASLDSSLTEIAAYSAKVDQLSVSLTKAEESATYWRAKQQKALKELWLWRGAAALLLGCVAGWFALRSGLKLAL